MKLQPVVLSGGSGTRLWPMSREHYPKQLLPLVSELSLLQETVARCDALGNKNLEAPIIVCNAEHRFLIAEQMRKINKKPAEIILEPTGRNTAPALTLAALLAVEKNKDAVLLVTPADHVIKNTSAFAEAVKNGHRLAEDGMLVTFGIVADRPETGYGYIQRGKALNAQDQTAYRIQTFVEKPDRATAQGYLDSGDFYWNSGMFVVRASVWLEAIRRLQPKMAAACTDAVKQGRRDLDFFRAEEKSFAACPSDSIDYAVMEPITKEAGVVQSAVIPLDAGWSDIGAWSALWEVKARDADGNVLKGDVYAHACKNSLINSESRFVAALGVNDVVIVETPDAVMVANKDRAQDVKLVVQWLKEHQRPETQAHQRVYRPWGSYESVLEGRRFQVKRITVNAGAALSLQMHHHRAEHWIVVTGTARVTRGDEVFLLSENESTFIPLGITHRLENPGKMPLEMIEVQSGAYLGEDDIVRFEDQYGR